MAKCVQCGKGDGRYPDAKHLFCTVKCVNNYLMEKFADWEICKECGEWTDRNYECRNSDCPTNTDTELADENKSDYSPD